ncbi:DUF2079 domain-containing protein [Streptomyces sp. 1331.2]|uniref:DUF2079 domain-containing protein n=1 Tax=Streptomyces sp. 1331.2 TaxID=1938835 RepID=UPI000BDD8967|nr:DUF2079 domain-containing protein [Streptomyces sp. 1331.2]SOB86297.1 Uncharacterized membrane protein [Streptomyces sp. 1331.2]
MPLAPSPLTPPSLRPRPGAARQRRTRRLRRALSHPALPAWGLAAGFAALYACVGVNRHRRGLTKAYDLGIFEQAIRAYAHGRAPIVPLKGPGYHLLGDHFHPLVATLAPAYRTFPTPLTLVVAQALLMASAVVPLTRWAHEVAGPRVALLVGCATGASWGIVRAAADDFHEIAFAVPLLAFAAVALGRRRPLTAALWSLPLLLVKEDLGLTVAAVGLLIARQARRGRRSPLPGLALAAVGTAATALTVLVVLPAFNTGGGFDYWQQLDGGGHAPLWALPVRLAWPPLKWLLLLLLAATAGFLGLRSPLLLLCLPTLAWRLLSANPHYWGVSYHYSAVLMPVALAALVDAVRRSGTTLGATPGSARTPVRLPRRARYALATTALVTAVTLPLYPLHEVVMPEAWSTPPRLLATRAALDRIPDGATVAASNRLAAQLTSRTEVTLVCRAPLGRGPEWVAVDLRDPSVQSPCALAETVRMLAAYHELGYRKRVDQDDLVLLERP